MKKLTLLLSIMLGISCIKTKAGITLTAITNTGNPSVILQWNMINYPGSTAYTLYKSNDGAAWEIVAANPILREYSASTILAYRDKFSDQQKLFYKVKVYDVNENIVAVSNTAIANNLKNLYTIQKPSNSNNTRASEVPNTTNRNLWQIYSNPVGETLNLVYRGTNIIKGVINVIVQDVTGKAVVKFRAASNNKQLHIDVSNLHAAFYFIKINVLNEMQMNEKFIRQ